MGLRKLEQHERLIDAIDLKMSVFIAFYGAIVTGIFAGMFAIDLEKAAALMSPVTAMFFTLSLSCLTVGLYSSFEAFRPRSYYMDMRFADLVRYANQPPSEIREVFLPTLLKAVGHNEGVIGIKHRHAKRAVWSVFLALVGFLVAIVEIGIRTLRG